MTDNTAPLDVARAYFDAWTSRDLDRAMSFVAPDVVVDAPAGRIEGADAFRAFMGPFTQILKRANLIGAFGDDATALIMYDTETVPVPSAPAAECLTVRDGLITHDRFIFDRAPFDAARRESG